MASFLQYHNTARMGWVPLDGLPFLQTSLLIYTSRRKVLQALGGTLYLVVGLGGSPRSFYLWECFRIDEVREDQGRFFAQGPGWQLVPPQRLAGREFDAFRRGCASFVGFHAIDRLPYLGVLQELADRFHRTTFDADVLRFCDDLIEFLPASGDARFARAFVLQRLGDGQRALPDFQEALRLGTEYPDEVRACLRQLRGAAPAVPHSSALPSLGPGREGLP